VTDVVVVHRATHGQPWLNRRKIASSTISQKGMMLRVFSPPDRDRDRRRREELRGRKLSPTGLTELENAEYLKLEALFHEEDRDHDRLSELSWKEF
jgi:hypothetical protein